MPAIQTRKNKLPRRFSDLVAMMPPQAITDDVHHENVIQIIDQLMSLKKLSKGQEQYLETWVQLVGVYEASHHAIDTSDISGIALLTQLLEENDMNASDLARLLGVHASMGSKILKGERALTVEHVKTISECFCVDPKILIESSKLETSQNVVSVIKAKHPDLFLSGGVYDKHDDVLEGYPDRRLKEDCDIEDVIDDQLDRWTVRFSVGDVAVYQKLDMFGRMAVKGRHSNYGYSGYFKASVFDGEKWRNFKIWNFVDDRSYNTQAEMKDLKTRVMKIIREQAGNLVVWTKRTYELK